MARSLYVWTYLPGQSEPVVAGLFQHTEVTSTRGVGGFIYGASYLARPDCVALCPSVPLTAVQYNTTANGGYFGFLLDAGPDSWGRAIVDRLHGAQDPLGYLRLSDGGVRSGSLLFSDSPATVNASIWLAAISELSVIQQAASALELGQRLSPDAQRLLRPALSLGGARPKCSVKADGRIWIAKFRSSKDAPDLPEVARQEHAMYLLARYAGIDVPACKLIEVGGNAVFLTERFDVSVLPGGAFGRLRYASARSALEAPDIPPSPHGSYPGLARQMTKWSEHPDVDRKQLFRRLIFNIATSNTDDHELNHGFVDGPDVTWVDTLQLAPAFDLVPSVVNNDRVYQGMLVGDDGAVSSFDNAVTSARQFGLSDARAWEIVEEVADVVSERWQEVLQDSGIDHEGGTRLERAFLRDQPSKRR
ncbi:type II toxin-antitoxin system HipA family toxin [Streptomyces cavourensis]|nr:type II toxin-antitoxin system HipA family toxin [Streptomyces cavourensis]